MLTCVAACAMAVVTQNEVCVERLPLEVVWYDSMIVESPDGPTTLHEHGYLYINNDLSRPAINNDGLIAFAARERHDGDDVHGIWTIRGDTLEPAIRAGAPAPGDLTDAPFYEFQNFILNDRGDLAFEARTEGWLHPAAPSYHTGSGLWRTQNGQVEPIATWRMLLSETPPVTRHLWFSLHDFNNTGDVAFDSTYEWFNSFDEDLWTEERALFMASANGAGNEPIQRYADPVPWLEPANRMIAGSSLHTRLSDNGSLTLRAAMRNRVGSDPWGFGNSNVLVEIQDETTTVLLADGEPAGPPFAPTTTMRFRSEPFFSSWYQSETSLSRGHALFMVEVIETDDQGLPRFDSLLVLAHASGETETVISTRTPPGALDPESDSWLFAGQTVNSAGQSIAGIGQYRYTSASDNTPVHGIYVTRGHRTQPIIETPTMSLVLNGEPTLSFAVVDNGPQPMLNARSQAAFSVALRGDSVDTTNDYAIVATNSRDQLFLVARQGDLFDPGDGLGPAPIRSMGVTTGTPAGRNRGFNDRGEIVMHITLEDGREAIVRTTITEPCTADRTTTDANPGEPGYGVADGTSDIQDLTFFVEHWLADDAHRADVATENTVPSDAAFNLPDDKVTVTDLTRYVEAWINGCP